MAPKPAHGSRNVSTEVLEGRVRGLGHQGEGAVETSQGIVFVPGALPGETLRLTLTGRARGALRGKLVETLVASPDRVTSVCAHASQCGGCPLITMSIDAQRHFKRSSAEAALARFSESSMRLSMTESPAVVGYRARARLAFSCGSASKQLGYRRDRSKRLADIADCAVLDAVCQQGLRLCRMQLLPVLDGEGEVLLGHGAGDLPVLWLRCEAEQPAKVYRACESLVQEGNLAGLSLTVAGGVATARFGDPRQYAMGADGQPLWGAPGGFSQSNPAINRALCDFVLDCAEPAGKRLLELFCGHGNFSVLFARAALSLDAVEADKDAVEACRHNLAARGLDRARVHCSNASTYRPKGPVDVVVLDPPRTGAREVLPALISWRPAVIVYVSCDLPTLTRDLGSLHQAGYTIDRAHAFDMFPNTAHMEIAVRLRRESHARR